MSIIGRFFHGGVDFRRRLRSPIVLAGELIGVLRSTCGERRVAADKRPNSPTGLFMVPQERVGGDQRLAGKIVLDGSMRPPGAPILWLPRLPPVLAAGENGNAAVRDSAGLSRD